MARRVSFVRGVVSYQNILFLLSTNHFTFTLNSIQNAELKIFLTIENDLQFYCYWKTPLLNDLDFISGQYLKIIKMMKFSLARKFKQQFKFNHKFINVFKRLHRCPLLKQSIVLRPNLNCASDLWSIRTPILRNSPFLWIFSVRKLFKNVLAHSCFYVSK